VQTLKSRQGPSSRQVVRRIKVIIAHFALVATQALSFGKCRAGDRRTGRATAYQIEARSASAGSADALRSGGDRVFAYSASAPQVRSPNGAE